MKYEIILALCGIIVATEAKCPSTNGLTDICYEDLYPYGCFTTDPPWGNTDERPFSQLPTCTEDVKANYHLDTRSQLGFTFTFDGDLTVLEQQPGFDKNHNTKFIVHGYLDNGETQWMNDMSERLLLAEDCNVIRVGWRGASTQINYISSATDTQIMGSELAIIVDKLKDDLGMSPPTMHCIGHSLGSHICSYMGSFVRNIGRISGLDPAGPYFEGTPNEVKLDDTDANYVDILHTDADNLVNMGYGTTETTGHIDYWPNDGMKQPGCDQNFVTSIWGGEGAYGQSRDFVACNHLRAYKFFTDSIIPQQCKFYSYECENYDTYLDGECLDCGLFSDCSQMGYYSNENQDSGGFTNTYLETYIEEPFCVFMTEVKINFGPNSDAVRATLHISMYGTGEASDQQPLFYGEEVEVRSTTTLGSLVNFKKSPDSLQYIKFLWKQEEVTITPNRLAINSIDLYSSAENAWFEFCLDDITMELEEEIRYPLYEC